PGSARRAGRRRLAAWSCPPCPRRPAPPGAAGPARLLLVVLVLVALPGLAGLGDARMRAAGRAAPATPRLVRPRVAGPLQGQEERRDDVALVPDGPARPRAVAEVAEARAVHPARVGREHQVEPGDDDLPARPAAGVFRLAGQPAGLPLLPLADRHAWD